MGDSLPDEILCNILSFIPTKQAIFTSILSKRWIHLWRHVPTLYFINKKLNSSQDIHHFNQFVKAVLQKRDYSLSSRSINTFFLDIQYDFSNLLYYDHGSSITNINNWVSLAVQRNVQYLHLFLHARFKCETIPPKLPASILGCTTLVVLKLCWFYVDKVSPFPFRFPSLKTLDLKDMYFDQCPDFTLLLDGSLANVEFLRVKLWKGYLPNGFPTFHNLTHLAVNYDCDLAVQVLQHCPKLRNLELYPKLKYAWRDEYITKDDQELVPGCLSSSLTTCTIRDFASTTLESLIMLA